MRGTPLERFFAKVQPEPNTGCWLWLGAVTSEGYGHINIEGVTVPAHSWYYKKINKIKKFKQGIELDHLCRVRSCVNPLHLKPVTKRVNILRGFGAAAICARKTHCIRGHLLAGDNLITNKHHPRMCRACHRMHNRGKK